MSHHLEPSVVEVLREFILAGVPLRKLAAHFQVSRTTVMHHRGMLRRAMGTLPPCPCGRAIGHRGWCPQRTRVLERAKVPDMIGRAD